MTSQTAQTTSTAAGDNSLPVVELFALGGTIASAPRTDGEGVSPTVRVEDLVAAVPGLVAVAQVRATQVLQVPSCEVTPGDVVELAARMRAAVDAGAAGCVVTQGTDTLEETAFLLDLLWDREAPVVVTGAMRTPDAPGADGPANLLGAVTVAASDTARGAGVLAVVGDQIHAARYVHKAHTSAPSAFVSPGTGPIGWLVEGRAALALTPRRPAAVHLAEDTPLPEVLVVRVGMGESPALLSALVSGAVPGVAGVVLEGVGGGHVPRALVPALRDLVARVPVVLASRTGAGETLSRSYGYPGGDVDLTQAGLVPSGTLDAARARLTLRVALAVGVERGEVEDCFRRLARTD
ncbi:asparaginase [Nocardioides yefusunii]|uniref:Asparaginase n=1 Tax=Nocardioides yefusunii TaxID=2500546 RepID=A0ABW1QTN3_9ACTN|nr:asparaginase [Nocardioides yefusunii]